MWFEVVDDVTTCKFSCDRVNDCAFAGFVSFKPPASVADFNSSAAFVSVHYRRGWTHVCS